MVMLPSNIYLVIFPLATSLFSTVQELHYITLPAPKTQHPELNLSLRNRGLRKGERKMGSEPSGRELCVGNGKDYSVPHHSARRKRRGKSRSCGWKEMEGVVARKRVMVVMDSARAKEAMMWALTHVANKGDCLALLHVLPPRSSNSAAKAEEVQHQAQSLGAHCKACKPEVEVEALVVRGPKLATVLSQVKKLEVSVLVLSQAKPSPFSCMFRSSDEEFVEECIEKAGCLAMSVRKQSNGVGGYLVSTRWHKNFWLLA